MYMNLINGAMDLDQLEQGVYQHHIVDRSRFPLAHEGEPACDSGGGDHDDVDDYGGAG
ncbi:hypothetical protein L195_g039550 [Trifolium pratense]|uniref:Uncharacterized protein n=1 Tax=Trifolium pratense TaxID=57577 RepID=A0A2K3LY97_TRIPR|nr:hypothetical protein L195_g039550 [Trifolium pratense]